MRRVAGDASFRLHRRMLKDKWAGLFRVAGEADLVLRCRGAQLLRKEAAMRIVAIRAGEQAFIHSVMHGFGELRLYFTMASVAEHRLCHHQQCSFHFGMMRRVAIDAANIVLQVLRTQEVRVFFTKFMTVEATLTGFFARECAKPDNFRDVPTTLDMCLAWPMTCLASLKLHTAMIEHRFPMRSVIVRFGDVIVAGAACVGACIQRWIGRILDKLLRVLSGLVCLLPGSDLRSC